MTKKGADKKKAQKVNKRKAAPAKSTTKSTTKATGKAAGKAPPAPQQRRLLPPPESEEEEEEDDDDDDEEEEESDDGDGEESDDGDGDDDDDEPTPPPARPRPKTTTTTAIMDEVVVSTNKMVQRLEALERAVCALAKKTSATEATTGTVKRAVTALVDRDLALPDPAKREDEARRVAHLDQATFDDVWPSMAMTIGVAARNRLAYLAKSVKRAAVAIASGLGDGPAVAISPTGEGMRAAAERLSQLLSNDAHVRAIARKALRGRSDQGADEFVRRVLNAAITGRKLA